MLPAIPNALAASATDSPRRRAAAAVAPKMPQIAVGWKPRRWNSPGVAIPIRVTISLPATIAARSSRPGAACDSAAADAAGTTTVLTCATESECVSSKSSPWQSIAFANAAFGAGSPAARPITDASGSPPSSAIAVRPSAGDPEPMRGEAAPEHVERVQLCRSEHLVGHRLELELERERREPFRCRCHQTLHSSAVPGKLRFASGAPRL